MPKPIIYLAFANQEDAHLPLLKEEIGELKRILRPLERREFIQVLTDESATTDEIVRSLSDYPDRIAIFHYAGHAGQELLQLEGGDAHSKGLSKLLGEQAGIKLVFLNGCSTYGQVQELLSAGVAAVIATSVPINDGRAVAFATAFYQALASKRTLRGAFEFARHTLETKYSETPTIQMTRGELTAQASSEELPWGLYLQEEKADATLDWRLPYYREVGLPQDMIQYIGKSFQLNRYIVLVLDEMCRYNKDIYSQMVEVRDGEEIKKDSSTYLDLVIQNFPWVIGSQIQLLRQHNQADRSRLDQLLSTYIISTMVLYYLLLNDVWDEVHRQRHAIPRGFLESFRQTRENLLSIDFLDRLLSLRHLMEEHGCRLFVPEMEPLCQELKSDSHLRKAWRHLEQLRSNPPGGSDLEKACLTAEQALAIILKFAAFLADYRMLTIRNISIDNPRYSEVAYELNLGALNAIVNTSLSLYEDAEKRRKQSFSNCKSIVLSPTERDLDNSLNLSPFIIDKNTFLNKNHIDLFLYGFEEEGKYYYFAIKHSIFIALANEKGTDIIHTGMTLEDFQEGRNITHQQQSEDDDFGFSEAFGLSSDPAATAASPKVFPLLESQFAQFKSDFS